nr:MAG TPA: hypothetical protein [Caudoviricetes sp.]
MLLIFVGSLVFHQLRLLTYLRVVITLLNRCS